MGKSLYRSYRSKTFDEIVGQDHIVAVLKNSLKNDSVSHAYLMSGPRGVGKTSTARILAHAVNGLDYSGENVHLDIIEIDAASNRRIDEVREIREKVHIAPVSGKYKVYIIDEVHMLTKEAFNALLKTLEEPPAHAIFILATTETHKVPDTILSRCIKLNFKPIGDKDLVLQLTKIAKSEKINITKDALNLVSKHANGSFRDGISLLEQVKYFANEITPNEVNHMLGVASDDLVNKLIDALLKNSLTELRNILGLAYEQGVNEGKLASQISEKLRELLVDTSTDKPTKINILDLQENLLGVHGSPNPNIELEICLNKFIFSSPISQHASEEPKPNINKPPAPVESKTVEEPVPKIVDHAETKVELPTNNEKVDVFWSKVLDDLKKHNNTLYGIVRMAEVNKDNNQINLQFKFAFHHKQMKEPKNTQIINEIVKNTLGKDIIVNFELIEKSTKKQSNQLNNLSNIFGGHEVLES